MGLKAADAMDPIDDERLIRLWRKATLDTVPPILPLHGVNFAKLVQEETIQRVATYMDGWICPSDAGCRREHCAGMRDLQKDLRRLAGQILR